MKTALYILAVVAVIGASLLGARKLILTRPEPKRAPAADGAFPVEALRAKRTREPVVVTAMGTVVPARTVEIQPQVTGVVVAQSEQLVPGGRFGKGELMLRVDPRDYEAAVAQRKGDLERARFELEVEQGRRHVAEREWTLLGTETETTPAGRSLALREPHIRNAKAAVEAAQAALDLARYNLERTELHAPFNAVVLAESVDEGQLVSPQSRLAELAGTDAFWVRVSIPVRELSWLRVPGVNAAEGSGATVIQETGNGEVIRRRGSVLRLLGDLEPAGRMARLIVTVPDPLGLKAGAEGLPLLLGAYVRVEMEGPVLEGVFAVPRKVVHEGDRVWVATADDRLAGRRLEVAWRRETDVLVRSGIEEGERVITTAIPSPIPGMKLRVTPAGGKGDSGPEGGER
jgi:RND family efflux transporter MFP subunit